MSKIHLISTLLVAITLTACGQKGALYLPKDTASEMPSGQTTNDDSNAVNPTDLNHVQNPKQTTSAIDPNSQNPNITPQDKTNDYW